GLVETADDVHQRRLAGTGRAHDGDELAVVDPERHAAQGHHFGRRALGVDLADVRQLDDRMSRHQPAASSPMITRSPSARPSPCTSAWRLSVTPTRTVTGTGWPFSSR